ncbi:hypothetical protein CVT26_008644 [Gymnopilus dilepis]|uniref:Uncharacterized protein n=1 Tax=Gymnopilus dilepis TaxID=231916 RepID=A0A409XXX3_9AGAR|nr:hypothetical protein CVT26_008644 [Gymnopilus dilepis]
MSSMDHDTEVVSALQNHPPSSAAHPIQPQGCHFDHLPFELVSKTFMIYASDEYREGSGKSILNLGAVCKRWREIAWGIPEMWASLRISISTYKRCPPESFWVLVEEWLGRSQMRPLTMWISFSLSDRSNTLHQEIHHGQRLLDILNRHCEQWFELELFLPTRLIPQLGSSSCSLSKLQKLDLHGDGYCTRTVTASSLTQHTPRSIKIAYAHVNPSSFNWTSVTKVTLSYYSVDHVLEVLRLAPRLTSCGLEYIDYGIQQGAFVMAHNPTVNHALEGLYVLFSDEDAERRFFEQVSLPSLGFLSISSDNCTLHVSPLRTFLLQSACSLSCLQFRMEDYDDADSILFVSLLFDLPSLEEIDISGHSTENGFLQALYNALIAHLPTYGRSVPLSLQTFLPSLRVFNWSGSILFPWEIIAAFLAPLNLQDERCGRRPLQEINIQCWENPHRRGHARLIPYGVLARLYPFVGQVYFTLEQQLHSQWYDWWQMSEDNAEFNKTIYAYKQIKEKPSGFRLPSPANDPSKRSARPSTFPVRIAVLVDPAFNIPVILAVSTRSVAPLVPLDNGKPGGASRPAPAVVAPALVDVAAEVAGRTAADPGARFTAFVSGELELVVAALEALLEAAFLASVSGKQGDIADSGVDSIIASTCELGRDGGSGVAVEK